MRSSSLMNTCRAAVAQTILEEDEGEEEEAARAGKEEDITANPAAD